MQAIERIEEIDIDDDNSPDLIEIDGRLCMPVVVMDSHVPASTIIAIVFITTFTQALIAGAVFVALLVLNVI